MKILASKNFVVYSIVIVLLLLVVIENYYMYIYIEYHAFQRFVVIICCVNITCIMKGCLEQKNTTTCTGLN